MAIYHISATIAARGTGSSSVMSASYTAHGSSLSEFAADKLKGAWGKPSRTIARLEHAWGSYRRRQPQSDVRMAAIAQAQEAAENNAEGAKRYPDWGWAQRLSETFAVLSSTPKRTGEQSRAAYAAVAEAKRSAYRGRSHGSKR